MTIPSFKVGDTIKIVSVLRDENNALIDISAKTIVSILKKGAVEITGTVTKLDANTVQSLFVTTSAEAGRYQSDIRFTEGAESFSTPTLQINLEPRVS